MAGIAARVPDDARALMDAFWPGSLTLLLTPQPTLAWDLAGDAPLAVRMPLHPVALALLAQSGPLVATTANQPGMPAPADVDDAVTQLGDAIGLALDAGDLSEAEPLPSTVVDVTGEPAAGGPDRAPFRSSGCAACARMCSRTRGPPPRRVTPSRAPRAGAPPREINEQHAVLGT